MQIYLPIAEMSVNVLVLLAMGGVVGFLSGLFGVGGGFLMTPLLIFLGVPAAVAVASGANQFAAASVTGAITHWRRRTVDFKMGGVLLVGGVVGTGIGVWVFRILRDLGQAEFMISLTYLIFLGGIGGMMIVESTRAILHSRRPTTQRKRLHPHFWVHGWPLRMRFPRSKLYISALPPLGIGFLAGMLAAIMGVGGGFFLVPAMIYVLGMPTAIAVGTSLFQIIFVTTVATFLHAVTNQTVDVILAMITLVGAVMGAQFGSNLGTRMRGEQLRVLLGVLILSVGLRLGYDLVATPIDPYSVAPAITP